MGDGRRQFYFVLNLQFGLEGQYGTGKLFFKDFEIVNVGSEEYPREEYREVGSDGLIENFDNYDFNSDMYFVWLHSEGNKDEYLNLNKQVKVGSNNIACGQFEYKSDMEPALYYLPVKAAEGSTFTSLSLWLKDASMLSGDGRAAYITNWSPDVTVKIRLATGEIYDYLIKKLDRAWYEYDIPFDQFKISNEDELTSPAKEITSETITHIGVQFQYFYYDADGKPMPLYSISNPVYIDNIYFSKFEAERKIVKDRIVSLDSTSKLAVVEDFEGYDLTSDMLDFWNNGKQYEYQKMELSNDVSSQGGNHSIKLQYMTKKESPSYFIAPAIDDTVQTKVFRFDIKSEQVATVYLNFYTNLGGQEVQFRATLSDVGNQWTRYILGFSNIHKSGEDTNFNINYIQNITRITFGMTCYAVDTEQLAYVYVDNLVFDGNYDSYGTNIQEVITE